MQYLQSAPRVSYAEPGTSPPILPPPQTPLHQLGECRGDAEPPGRYSQHVGRGYGEMGQGQAERGSPKPSPSPTGKNPKNLHTPGRVGEG